VTAVRYPIPAALTAIPGDGHAVIEASAGTGKTYLIEHRVVDLIIRGAELGSILVVTFTEKATEELRARVRALIRTVLDAREHTADGSEPHWLIDDDARAALRGALHGFDAAPIYTIHGFCYRVLTENAFVNQRLFEQTQIDRESAFGNAFKACLRREFARDPDQRPYLEAALRGGSGLGALEKLLLTCANAGGTLEPVFDESATRDALAALPAPDPEQLSASAEELRAALKLPGMRASVASKLFGHMVTIATLRARYRDDADLPGLLAGVESNKEALPYLLKYLTKKVPTDARAAELREFALAFAGAVVPLRAALVARFLPFVRERMAADKRRLGLFDFNDMLDLVWQSLCADGGEALAARLRAQYRHALIDEFQDTDELQWKIFHRLFVERGASGAGGADGADAHTLCVIGDPKQAIYSFRGADVHTYLGARDAILADDGTRIALTDNYRASAALVDAYNELLRQDVETPLFTGEIAYDEPVIARAPVVADGPPVVVMRMQPAKKLNPAGIKELLGPAIAREIRDIIGALRWNERGDDQTLSPGDIFVLTRSTKDAVQMSELLRAVNVPCALYKQDGLFQTREAADILALLRGVAEPGRQSERFQAWQTPFFAVPLADLIEAHDLPETHPLITRLMDWKRLADRQAWEQLFDDILSDSGVIRRELFLRNSERELTNYLHLFELLLDEARSSRLDLAGLIRQLAGYVERQARADGSDHGVQRLESERNAVQIMTMHKAKGLEAPVVFLYGSFGRAPTDLLRVYHRGRERVAHLGKLLDPELSERADEERRQEEQRLIYVALTRAKVRLYVPHIASEHCSSHVQGAYTYLRRQVARVLDDPRFAVVDIDRVPDDNASASGAELADWQPAAALLAEASDDGRFASWREQRRGPTVTSYTRMKQRRGAAPPPPMEAEEFRGDVDRAGAPAQAGELPGGAATGVFLHDVLERLPFASFAESPSFAAWRERDDIARLFRSQMLRHGRDPEHLEHAQRLVHGSLTMPVELAGAAVDGLWRSVCGGHEGREVEFIYASPADGGFVKGYIDLIFEHDGRVYLLDWKSDRLPSYSTDALAAHADSHYDLQIQLYTRAAVRLLGITSEHDYDHRFGGMTFCFLRGPSFWSARPPWHEVRP